MNNLAPESPETAPALAAPGRAPTLKAYAGWWVNRFRQAPDLGRAGRLIVVAVTVAGIVCVILVNLYSLRRPLGDTDDAMRLVMVRDLLGGRGWYDQALPRFAPSDQAYLHWSRLLDGALAGAMALLRGSVGANDAEWITRDFWPLAWVFPAVLAALVTARSLGTRSAVFLTAPLLVFTTQLYRQFIPGRIDHHNVQITLTVVGLACALAPRRRVRWASIGGVAAALGLAVGLEALPFQAIIGAGYALELARDRRANAPAAAYGMALAVSTPLFWALQTPPWRWSLTSCDALSINLVAGLVAAGGGLVLTATLTPRLSGRMRLALLVATAGAAGAAYLGLAPECIHGPFAAMDPRVRPFWFNHIQEVQTLPVMLGLARPSAIIAMIMMGLGLAAGAVLVAREWPRPLTPSLLMALCLVWATITAYLTWRMQDYVFWLGIPALGAAYSHLSDKWFKGWLVPSLALSLVVSPATLGEGARQMVDATSPRQKAPAPPGPRCFAGSAYIPLTRLPVGVVLASPDLGPYILAFTRDRVLVAPYHRLAGAILAAHEAFNAPPARAEARVRALGADYVVDCPPYPMFLDKGSFGARLRQAQPPPWLRTVSATGAALSIYAVRKPSELTGR